VVVLDTISDMFDGLTTDEQAVLMKWQKSIVNRYNVAIINISHQRKAGSGEEEMVAKVQWVMSQVCMEHLH